MSNRVSQLAVEVLVLPSAPIDLRLSQLPIEVLLSTTPEATTAAQLSQLPIEVLFAGDPPTIALEAHATQFTLEMALQQESEAHLSQLVLEAAVQQPGQARVSALVVELAMRQQAGDLAMTLQVLEVLTDVDPPPISSSTPCEGGGTVAAGVNPPPGPDLAAATVPIAWVELTLVDGSVQRWAKATIPHGTPKGGRVLKFGTVTRRLSDGDGGPETSTVSTTFADTDRYLRTAAFAGTLHYARVDYYVADLETIRAAGPPQRVFRGRVQDWTADPDLKFSITVQDELTARLTSAHAGDAQSPIRTIDRTIHDYEPLASLYGAAAPEIYGSLADAHDDPPIGAAGTWELRHIANQTIDPGPFEGLGQLRIFLVCSGAVNQIRSVFAADTSADPPVSRVEVPASAFGDWLFVPTIAGAWFEDDPDRQFWEDTTGRRWTVVAGLPGHPAIELAVEGRIPLVVNLCGYEENGDATGRTLERPVRAFLHWCNNRLLHDAGGDWLAIDGLDDYSLFDTTTFDAVDATCEARGYRVAGVIGHDYAFTSWRDRVAEWCRNFGFEVGTNRHGQVILVMLDRDAPPAPVAAFTPATMLEGGASVAMRPDTVENLVPYVYARNYVTTLQRTNPAEGERGLRDPFDGEWQSDRLELVDEASITALGGHPRGERRARVQEYSLVRDGATADRVAAERLALHRPPNGRAEVGFRLVLRDGWALELGDLVTVDHWDLPWTGPRTCQVRALALDLDEMTVAPTVLDVEDLIVPGVEAFDSSARMDIATLAIARSGYPGDETQPIPHRRRRPHGDRSHKV